MCDKLWSCGPRITTGAAISVCFACLVCVVCVWSVCCLPGYEHHLTTTRVTTHGRCGVFVFTPPLDQVRPREIQWRAWFESPRQPADVCFSFLFAPWRMSVKLRKCEWNQCQKLPTNELDKQHNNRSLWHKQWSREDQVVGLVVVRVASNAQNVAGFDGPFGWRRQLRRRHTVRHQDDPLAEHTVRCGRNSVDVSFPRRQEAGRAHPNVGWLCHHVSSAGKLKYNFS